METRFREARLKKGLKAVEVAGLIEVTKVTLSTWENDQKLPSYENLIKLADLYDCSVDYLLGRAEASDGMPAGSKEINMAENPSPTWAMMPAKSGAGLNRMDQRSSRT